MGGGVGDGGGLYGCQLNLFLDAVRDLIFLRKVFSFCFYFYFSTLWPCPEPLTQLSDISNGHLHMASTKQDCGHGSCSWCYHFFLSEGVLFLICSCSLFLTSCLLCCLWFHTHPLNLSADVAPFVLTLGSAPWNGLAGALR